MMQTENKRSEIINKLSDLMPEAMRPLVGMFVERAISGVPDSELDNLLKDVDTVPAALESGNTDYLFEVCRKYGATDEQIQQVADGGLPLFPMSAV